MQGQVIYHQGIVVPGGGENISRLRFLYGEVIGVLPLFEHWIVDNEPVVAGEGCHPPGEESTRDPPRHDLAPDPFLLFCIEYRRFIFVPDQGEIIGKGAEKSAEIPLGKPLMGPRIVDPCRVSAPHEGQGVVRAMPEGMEVVEDGLFAQCRVVNPHRGSIEEKPHFPARGSARGKNQEGTNACPEHAFPYPPCCFHTHHVPFFPMDVSTPFSGGWCSPPRILPRNHFRHGAERQEIGPGNPGTLPPLPPSRRKIEAEMRRRPLP